MANNKNGLWGSKSNKKVLSECNNGCLSLKQACFHQMPDNCKENSISPLRQSAGLFSFCLCFIPLIHVLAWCESLAAQPSLAIKKREFKSPTLGMMQQQMCSWVLTHFQPSPCLRFIKLLGILISKWLGIPATCVALAKLLKLCFHPKAVAVETSILGQPWG